MCCLNIMMYSYLCIFQIDFTFTQALIGIRDVDKSGVTEDIFSEVGKDY